MLESGDVFLIAASPTVTDWLTAVGTVGATTVVLGLAAWNGWIRQIFFAPSWPYPSTSSSPVAGLLIGPRCLRPRGCLSASSSRKETACGSTGVTLR